MVKTNREREKGKSLLVDHERADFNLFPRELPSVDQRILLVEERHERRPIMASIALRRENESSRFVKYATIAVGCMCVRRRTYSRDWNLLNSPLSKRTWNAVQTKGAAASVLLTVSFPYEKPVPMGWSM